MTPKKFFFWGWCPKYHVHPFTFLISRWTKSSFLTIDRKEATMLIASTKDDLHWLSQIYISLQVNEGNADHLFELRIMTSQCWKYWHLTIFIKTWQSEKRPKVTMPGSRHTLKLQWNWCVVPVWCILWKPNTNIEKFCEMYSSRSTGQC